MNLSLLIKSSRNLIKMALLFSAIFFFGGTMQQEAFKSNTKNLRKLASELYCMEVNLYHEARGESYKGLLAVGLVTLNRSRSPDFPNTICGVVHQPYQFSWVNAGLKPPKYIPEYIKNVAYQVIMNNPNDITYGSLYFHNVDVNSGSTYKIRIGNHIFK